MNQNILSRLLSTVGLLLIIIYGVVAVFDVLPVKLLQPEWILNFTSTLCNFVTVPLFGIALIHLTGFFASSKQTRLQVRVARLSAVLAILFLLMQPMLAFAVRKNAIDLAIYNAEQISIINRKGAQLTKAISMSASFDELQASMLQLQGPALPDQARSVPLPELKKRTLEAIKTAQASYPGRLTTTRSPAYADVYKRIARTSILALLACIGFSVLAWNPVSEKNILLSYFQSIGLFGITSLSIYKGLARFSKEYQIKRQEHAIRNDARKSASIHQRQIRKAEAEFKRKQIADRKQAERSRIERDKMVALERKMELKRQLEEEKQRRGE
ncbi:MAG: hypothetical protein VKP70_04605 [Cyanobacteriota bacterium]|nr:hypothetical protein [Cyanobacteriota bacterium]